jgi:hypothetical protein
MSSYHGTTHRLKSEGGTDPIYESWPGGGPISGHAIADGWNTANGGSLSMQFRYLYWNDSSFSYADVVNRGGVNRARYLTISSPGVYMAQFLLGWDSNWTLASDFPYIEPMVYYVDTTTPDVLVNSDGGEGFNDAQGGVWMEQIAADVAGHHYFRTSAFFNFDPTVWGTDSLGLGMRIRSSVDRTKTWQSELHVTRLGDLVVGPQTIT